jgi:flagellar biosynthesis chaperone FliJ
MNTDTPTPLHTTKTSPTPTGQNTQQKIKKTLNLPVDLMGELNREMARLELDFTAYVQNILYRRHDGVSTEEVQKLRAYIAELEEKVSELDDLKEENRVLFETNNTITEENIREINKRDAAIHQLSAERRSDKAEGESWQEKALLLEAQLNAPTPEPDQVPEPPTPEPVPEPRPEKPKPNTVKILRRIILENTFFSNADIDLLIHENKNR